MFQIIQLKGFTRFYYYYYYSDDLFCRKTLSVKHISKMSISEKCSKKRPSAWFHNVFLFLYYILTTHNVC